MLHNNILLNHSNKKQTHFDVSEVVSIDLNDVSFQGMTSRVSKSLLNHSIETKTIFSLIIM